MIDIVKNENTGENTGEKDTMPPAEGGNGNSTSKEAVMSEDGQFEMMSDITYDLANRCRSDWDIKEIKGTLVCRNNVTGVFFSGTIIEFNKALRG